MQERFTIKRWPWSKVGTSLTKGLQLVNSMKDMLFTCRLKSEHNCSGKKRQTNARFMDDALKTRDIKYSNVEAVICLPIKISGYPPARWGGSHHSPRQSGHWVLPLALPVTTAPQRDHLVICVEWKHGFDQKCQMMNPCPAYEWRAFTVKIQQRQARFYWNCDWFLHNWSVMNVVCYEHGPLWTGLFRTDTMV